MPFYVSAEEKKGIVIKNLNLRTDATTESDKIKCENGSPVVLLGEVTILGEKESTTSLDTCPAKKWYKVKGRDIDDNKEYQGYGCASFINLKVEEPIKPNPNENKVIENDVVAYGTIKNGYVYSSNNTSSSLRANKTTEKIAILGDATNSNKTGCKDMYKILYNNLISYACKENFTDIVSVAVMDTSKISYDYQKELNKFPESYKKYLEELHKLHPNWRFYAIDTNLDFDDVVANEQKQSYLDGANNEGYFITLEPNYYDWKTNTWTSQDSGVWYVASKEAIEYYIDPRKYLNEKEIFVFEDSRSYTYQNDESLRRMIDYAGAEDMSIIYDEKKLSYYDAFKNASSFSKVSAMTTLARSRIETGKFTSNSVSGIEFEYNGNKYSGYYNYYNIGAWAHSGRGAVTNGLIYAYNAGWNNRYKAIVEGATFIATKYVYSGQENQYFQKFNVNPSSIYSIYGHQYQTNIQAPMVEGTYVYWGYNDSGNLDSSIVFHIPVYKNMRSEMPPKPVDGNPNNWLTGISIDGKNLKNHTDGKNETFDGNLYYSYDNNWDNIADANYQNNIIKYTVKYNVDKINIKATKAVSSSTVSGTGTIKLKDKTTTIDIVCKAANQTTKTYRIVVTKEDPPKEEEVVYADINKTLNSISIKYNSNYMYGLPLGTSYDTLKSAIKKVESTITVSITKNTNNKTSNFATGDVITISNGKDTKKFTYVLYGDLNGDCKIDILDLAYVRNIILDRSNLNGSYREAGDINHDGKIDILDLAYVRNDILGKTIKQ